MKSPSRPLDCVAGQVKGPFAQVQADVIPGNQFSAGSCLHPGCLPACRLCPILFVMWGGLRALRFVETRSSLCPLRTA